MAFCLKDGIALNVASLADRTIDRAQHGIGFTCEGTDFRFQRTGEETVEVWIGANVFFYCVSHVDLEVVDEPATHQIF